jgi:hypothetical protein
MVDVDFDGDQDLVLACRSTYPNLCYFENVNGDIVSEMHVINDSIGGKFIGIFSYDIDHDGDEDLFTSSLDPEQLFFFENLSADILISSESKQRFNNLEIFPNPTTSQFTIQFNEEFSGNISIINYLGQHIKSPEILKRTHSAQLDLSNHSAGIYFVLVRSADGREYKTYKVVKQ